MSASQWGEMTLARANSVSVKKCHSPCCRTTCQSRSEREMLTPLPIIGLKVNAVMSSSVGSPAQSVNRELEKRKLDEDALLGNLNYWGTLPSFTSPGLSVRHSQRYNYCKNQDCGTMMSNTHRPVNISGQIHTLILKLSFCHLVTRSKQFGSLRWLTRLCHYWEYLPNTLSLNTPLIQETGNGLLVYMASCQSVAEESDIHAGSTHCGHAIGGQCPWNILHLTAQTQTVGNIAGWGAETVNVFSLSAVITHWRNVKVRIWVLKCKINVRTSPSFASDASTIKSLPGEQSVWWSYHWWLWCWWSRLKFQQETQCQHQ